MRDSQKPDERKDDECHHGDVRARDGEDMNSPCLDEGLFHLCREITAIAEDHSFEKTRFLRMVISIEKLIDRLPRSPNEMVERGAYVSRQYHHTGRVIGHDESPDAVQRKKPAVIELTRVSRSRKRLQGSNNLKDISDRQ